MTLPPDRPAIMGILNVTPDSFSDGGEFFDSGTAIEAGLRMIDEGADLIDVGGESTRPGATPVPLEEELARILPVVQALATKIPVSIDTMKPEVARAALDAGAFLVNDVSGLRDPAMVSLVEERKSGVCIMHMQGDPRTMQHEPTYGDVVAEVGEYLVSRAQSVRAGEIWIDPGLGFGKTFEHNMALLRGLDEFVGTGLPVLLGVSRKSFIGRMMGGVEVGDRLEGTLAVQAYAQMKGVRVLRVHDVRASRRAVEALCVLAPFLGH